MIKTASYSQVVDRFEMIENIEMTFWLGFRYKNPTTKA